MGSIFGIILGTVFAFFASIFMPFFDASAGTDKAQVILPYNENEGIVWEYDCVNDPYTELIETEIKDGTVKFNSCEKGFYDN